MNYTKQENLMLKLLLYVLGFFTAYSLSSLYFIENFDEQTKLINVYSQSDINLSQILNYTSFEESNLILNQLNDFNDYFLDWMLIGNHMKHISDFNLSSQVEYYLYLKTFSELNNDLLLNYYLNQYIVEFDKLSIF